MRRLKTSWQDAVFAIGEVVFMVGLLPALFTADKPPWFTSLVTGLMLCAFVAVQVSYRNWWTVLLTSATASVWFVLMVQVIS